MKVRALALLLLLSALPAIAQTTAPPVVLNNGMFSLTASAVALPGGKQTVAGTVLGQTFAITNTVSLRADELISPTNNTYAYTGGAMWFPGKLQTLLSKSKLTGLVPYVTGSVGLDTVTPAIGPSQKHIAIFAGGGANYCINNSMCVNVAEVRWAKLPGLSNSTAIVSSGLTLTFGK